MKKAVSVLGGKPVALVASSRLQSTGGGATGGCPPGGTPAAPPAPTTALGPPPPCHTSPASGSLPAPAPAAPAPPAPCHPCLPRTAPEPPAPPITTLPATTEPPARAVDLYAERQARRKCPPPRCVCPDPPPPPPRARVTVLQRLAQFIGLSLRAAAVLVLVEATNQQGLWGDQEDAARLYGRAVHGLYKAAGRDLPVDELPEVPVVHDLTYALGSLWNRGVTLLFDGVRAINLAKILPSNDENPSDSPHSNLPPSIL